MERVVTARQIIEKFADGMICGCSGTQANKGILEIYGNKLLLQGEIIAKRNNGRIIVCRTEASPLAKRVTGILTEKVM